MVKTFGLIKKFRKGKLVLKAKMNKHFDLKKLKILLFIFIFIVLLVFLGKDAHSEDSLIYNISLKEAISMAQEKNKRLLSFKERIKIASWEIKENSSKLYPSLNLKGGLNYSKSLDERGYQAALFQGYRSSLSICLSQTLFDKGRTIAQIKRAKENFKEIEVEYELLKQEVIGEVADAYYNLVRIKEKKKTYQKEREELKTLYNIISAKLKEGLVSEIDTKRTKLALIEVEGKVNTAEREEELAQQHLKRLLSLPLHSSIKIKEELPEFKAVEFKIDEVISNALNNRPEVKKAQINLNKERFSKKIAQAQYWPNVTLDGNYTCQGVNKTLGKSLDKFKEYQWDISLNITMPLFDGGYIKSKLKQADSSIAEARIKLEEIKEMVIFDIKEKAIKIKEKEETVIRQQNSLSLAQENFKIMKTKYEEGMATLTEVLEANKTLTEIFIDYIDALCDYELYKIRFYIAQGEINAFL